jgi:hypothetical protein
MAELAPEESPSGPLSQVTGATREGENVRRLRRFGERALIYVKLDAAPADSV